MIISERRKVERYDLQIPALLQFEKGQEPVEHLTRDISSAGAFFFANESMPVGTPVKVDLMLPNRVQIKVNGAVVRSIDSGMAVRFDKGHKIIPEKA